MGIKVRNQKFEHWLRKDAWNEDELVQLCAGFDHRIHVGDSEANERLSTAISNELEEEVRRAVIAGTLKAINKPATGFFAKGTYNLKKEDAISWAGPRYSDFPFEWSDEKDGNPKGGVMDKSVFDYWLKKDLWTLREGICLLLGHDPRCDKDADYTHACLIENSIGHSSDSSFRDVERLWSKTAREQYKDLFELAKTSIKVGKLASTTKLALLKPHTADFIPGGFMLWAQQKGYAIPVEFQGLILDEQAAIPHDADEPTKPAELVTKSKEHYSDNLAYLIQAADRFWANADRSDAATHTEQSEVEKWLVSKGYPPSLAIQGARIIRPKWAVKGRPPNDKLPKT